MHPRGCFWTPGPIFEMVFGLGVVFFIGFCLGGLSRDPAAGHPPGATLLPLIIQLLYFFSQYWEVGVVSIKALVRGVDGAKNNFKIPN